MHQIPATINQVRENLAEAAYTAWIDKSFVPRATVMVNAMGKVISSVALEIKAAELAKSVPIIDLLPSTHAKLGDVPIAEMAEKTTTKPKLR